MYKLTNPVDILAVRTLWISLLYGMLNKELKQGGSVQDILQITICFFQPQTLNMKKLIKGIGQSEAMGSRQEVFSCIISCTLTVRRNMVIGIQVLQQWTYLSHEIVSSGELFEWKTSLLLLEIY